jgi:energy-coupling factor transport system substrate-specific component
MTESQTPAEISPRRSDSVASARIAMLALIPSAVAFNLAIATVVRTIKLPIYLDCMGCIITTLLAGVWPGAAVAVLSQTTSVVLGSPPDFLYYTGTVVFVGLAAHVMGRMGGFKTWWRIIISGLVMGVVSATVSAPITYWRGGVTSAGSTWVTAIFLVKQNSLLASVIYSGITCDLPDKVAEAFICVWLIRSVPRDLLRRFHGGTLEKNFTVNEPDKA